MTCSHCAELEAEVAWLKAELGVDDEFDRLFALKRKFGLSPNEGRLVLRLRTAKGRVVTRDALLEALPPRDSEDRSLNLLSSVVAHIRAKLAEGSIETAHNLGYALTAAGLRKVELALIEAEAA